MTRVRRFLAELRRRRVVRSGVAYAVGALATIEAADLLAPRLGIPEWMVVAVVAVALTGLPVVLVLAWVYDWSDGELRRTGEGPPTSPEDGPAVPTSRVGALGLVALGALMTLLAVGGYAALSRRMAGPDGGAPPRVTSIAVVPFRDMSAERNHGYLSEGIAEELRNSLARVPGLRVAARTSSRAFEAAGVDLASAADLLGVEAVLEGSVRRSGERLRIVAQLVDVANGYVLWSRDYDRTAADALAIQEDITRSILDSLRVHLPGARGTAPTSDPEAYRLYLQARHALAERAIDSIPRAIERFRRALDRDPEYSLAHAGLADAYLLMGEYRRIPRAEAYARAAEAATEAIARDSTVAEAFNSSAYVRYWLRDFDAAARLFERAVALNPSLAPARQWYAEMLLTVGRPADAVEQIRAAGVADPLSPVMNGMVGYVHARAGRSEEALAHYAEAFPDSASPFPFVQWGRGLALLDTGEAERALAAFEQEQAISPHPLPGSAWIAGDVARALVGAGRTAEAEALMENLRTSPEAFADPTHVARVEAALGRVDEAIESLERAFALDPALLQGQAVLLTLNPAFDPLRSDPRFRSLLGRMGLPTDPG